MKKLINVSVLLLLSLMALIACINNENRESVENDDNNGTFEVEEQVEVGLIKISIEELERKFNNRETFLLLTYAEDDKDMERTNYLNAHNQVLKQHDLVAYYVNLVDMKEEEIEFFEDLYGHPDVYWRAVSGQVVLVVDGLAGLVESHSFKHRDWMTGERNYFDRVKKIDSGIKEIIIYMNHNNIILDN
jgi:hypothetical protein